MVRPGLFAQCGAGACDRSSQAFDGSRGCLQRSAPCVCVRPGIARRFEVPVNRLPLRANMPRTSAVRRGVCSARRRPGSVFDKVLYFPHIRVPDNEWFTRALLYWDEVGTIVPHGPPQEVRDVLGEHTLRLMDAGLVSPVKAGSAQGVPRFDDAFIELVEADPAIPRVNVPGTPRKTFQLHMTNRATRSQPTSSRAVSSSGPAHHGWRWRSEPRIC
jgi:hypothetical protein